MTYDAFLAEKLSRPRLAGVESDPPEWLYPFQRDLVRWALRRGKAALFCDCGLGKTLMALAWADIVSKQDGRVLILTPLAVGHQFVAEAQRFGIRAAQYRQATEDCPIVIANYERVLSGAVQIGDYAAVVLDESSIIKDHTSKTRVALTDALARHRWILALSATPAPNDHTELGNHSELLGTLSGWEFVSTYFIQEEMGKAGAKSETRDKRGWRPKGHAIGDLWQYVSTWGAVVRSPSDIGYDGSQFELPSLQIVDHSIPASREDCVAMGVLTSPEAVTLTEQRQARRQTLAQRVALATELVTSEPGEPWVVWCELNDESTALAKAIPNAIEVRGSQTTEDKESRLARFSEGGGVIVTKPSIAGHGLNWQHCARVCYVGVGHSYEQWYQSIRRVWRYGQTRPVVCHVISSELEGRVVRNLRAKQDAADEMTAQMVALTACHVRREIGTQHDDSRSEYNANAAAIVPRWLRSET